MSLVELKVELPSYSHSFTVQVPETGTVLDVKEKISTTCTGSPRVFGQKLIWRGRFLMDDERIADIWNTEPRIVHLSVHPTAWSSNPPNHSAILQPTAATPLPPFTGSQPQQANTPFVSQAGVAFQQPYPTALPQMVPTPTFAGSQFPNFSAPTAPTPTSITTEYSLAYLMFQHKQALSILTHYEPEQISDRDTFVAVRNQAVLFAATYGYQWPAILDEPFPPMTPGGVKFTQSRTNGSPYLVLTNPGTMPTPAQIHALNVLSYTLTLLSLPLSSPSVQSVPTQMVTTPHEVQALLQQLGVHGLPPIPPANQNPNVRVIELRPFLVPMMILLFRTVLLLYFVAPARKPIFGLLIAAWVAYEIWQPIRNRLNRLRRTVEAANPQAAGQAAANAQGQPGAAPVGPLANNNTNNHQFNALTDTLGTLNIANEEQLLAAASEGVAQETPTLSKKAFMFFSLLAGTVHPAVWNRRRAALRRREGRIRTEANVRDTPPPVPPADENAGEGEGSEQQGPGFERIRESEERTRRRAEAIAQHERRPPWVRSYIQRVVDADWVDDAD